MTSTPETWPARWQTTASELAATEALGRWWGEHLPRGVLMQLQGTLGAGKTTFTRALGAGLDVSESISSPTFIICRRHEGRLPLFHIDAYRLEDPTELILQGWDDMRSEGLVVMEWGERVPELLAPERVRVTIEHRGEHCRSFSFEGRGSGEEALVEQLRAHFE